MGIFHGKEARSGFESASRESRYSAITMGDAKRYNPLGWKSLSLINCQREKGKTPGTMEEQT